MKKISILVALAAIALGFSSCSEDRGPKYHEPTKFVLNEPAMMDQYIVLTEGNTLELTCSQPDYGYSAVANYSAEVSLTQDFKMTYSVSATNNHLAAMSLKQEDIATAICALLEIDNEDNFNEEYPDGMPFSAVYFRANCELEGIPGSQITSNVVKYNHIKGYFSVPQPGVVYLVGNINGWNEPSEANASKYADWRLFEDADAIGSHIYSGDFELPEEPMFRFYTALTGWEDDSYGYIVDDNATSFPDWTGANDFSSAVVKGKGSWSFPNYAGGKVHIVFNMSDEKNILFEMTPIE